MEQSFVKLGVFDRLILLNILKPERGDVTKIRLVSEICDLIGFTGDEYQRLQFKTDGQQVHWITEAEEVREFALDDGQMAVIRDVLDRLNERQLLTQEHLPVWDKFCRD